MWLAVPSGLLQAGSRSRAGEPEGGQHRVGGVERDRDAPRRIVERRIRDRARRRTAHRDQLERAGVERCAHEVHGARGDAGAAHRSGIAMLARCP